jgi:hypothetical protein
VRREEKEMEIINAIIKQRRDIEANWINANPVLALGELGIVVDGENKDRLKRGDGETRWNNLNFTDSPIYSRLDASELNIQIINEKTTENSNGIINVNDGITEVRGNITDIKSTAIKEAAARIQGDETLQDNLDEETLARMLGYNSLQSLINAINSKIPNQASSTNQLADKDFVNSSIANMASNYVTSTAAGDQVWASLTALRAGPWFYRGTSYTPTKNDYTVFSETDGSIWRATHDGTQWNKSFKVNDTPFTAAQLAALDSGITAALVEKINTAYQSNTNITLAANSTETDIGTSAITDTISGFFIRIRNAFNWVRARISLITQAAIDAGTETTQRTINAALLKNNFLSKPNINESRKVLFPTDWDTSSIVDKWFSLIGPNNWSSGGVMRVTDLLAKAETRSNMFPVNLTSGTLTDRCVAMFKTDWSNGGFLSLQQLKEAIGGGGFNPRGAWSSANDYKVNDIVTSAAGRTWRCRLAHTAANGRDPDLSTEVGGTSAIAAQYWELWANRGADGTGQAFERVVTSSNIDIANPPIGKKYLIFNENVNSNIKVTFRNYSNNNIYVMIIASGSTTVNIIPYQSYLSIDIGFDYVDGIVKHKGCIVEILG